MTERMPNVFLIGAGPVATALAGGLRTAGVPVLGLWARRADAATEAGEAAGVVGYTGRYPELLLEADAVIVAVRDQAVGEVAEKLVDAGATGSEAVLLHCSGARSAEEAFAAVRDRVAGVGTLHPLRAIADGKTAARRLSGTVFGVQGDERGGAMARSLALVLGGAPLELQAAEMPAYHAAAAIASNYVVALFDAAREVLAGLGMSDEDAVRALVPLARGSLDNLEARGPLEGLTGPIRRGDRATVERHLATLPADVQGIYRTLGMRTVALARRLGEAADADLDSIAELLQSE